MLKSQLDCSLCNYLLFNNLFNVMGTTEKINYVFSVWAFNNSYVLINSTNA